ncbi:quercetin -dioxygenase [Leptolyngbya sp. Heron Island J]|uniref:pirin family protein n=1 Tax=Leptolyngbya sp. Heron Island J TaxID=1385935 RepID=UPI0003B9A3F2|nr:hypothetical protein [Leptolyngbya sp. Heron Island J]ESA37020.1 quercetin -dioxygenase [Leptolyngbya sp. Heron Island J]
MNDITNMPVIQGSISVGRLVTSVTLVGLVFTGVRITLGAGDSISYDIATGRYSWVQVARGIIMLNGNELREGDGIQLVGAKALTIEAQTGAELLLFDLA